MPTGSVAKVYAEVLAGKPQEYWDYDIHEITWGYACVLLGTLVYRSVRSSQSRIFGCISIIFECISIFIYLSDIPNYEVCICAIFHHTGFR